MHCFSASRVITAITITVITVFTEGVSEGKENVKWNLTIYIIYKYIIYIVSSGMRKRKVFRETVITVIVIAFEEKSYGGCELQNYGL